MEHTNNNFHGILFRPGDTSNGLISTVSSGGSPKPPPEFDIHVCVQIGGGGFMLV
jgi:hypothetical protein